MASRGVNKVILIGNLGQKPEVRYFTDGTPLANFSLATSESRTEKLERRKNARNGIAKKSAEAAGYDWNKI